MEYGGLNAKIKAMRSRLLRYDEFESLSGLKTVEEVGLKLKEHPSYRKALGSLEGAELRRGNIEYRLKLSLYNDYMRLYKFISGYNQKKYAKAFFMRYEIDTLQLLLSKVFDEREISYELPDINHVFGDKLSIDIKKLYLSNSILEFIENLKGTPYYAVLVRESEREYVSLFEMDTKLDVYYYVNLWRLQNKYLDKNNIKALSVINEVEIDMRNLMWLYRLKKYYHMSDEAIYGYLIPVGQSLTHQGVSDIIRANTDDELINEMSKTKYGSALLQNNELEKNFNTILIKLCKATELKNPNSLAALFSYINEKLLEINNLTSLLEGVRYRLTPEGIMGHLNLGRQAVK